MLIVQYKGLWLLMDDEDLPLLMSRDWHITGNGYLSADATYFHREIKQPIPVGYVVDHINGDKQDYRKINLRYATYSLNNRNTHGEVFRGYSYTKVDGSIRYCAQARIDGKSFYLGNFRTKRRAATVMEYNRRRLLEGLPPIGFREGKSGPFRVEGPSPRLAPWV